jgi:hypothetical protein
VMQLPGRALMVHRRVSLSGDALLAVSLVLQAVGLLVVGVLPSSAAVAVGVMTFAVGSGLTTLARPYLVQSRFALEQVGVVNGRLARAQQLTRAAGPIAALTSHATVLVLMGVALGALAWRVAAHRRPSLRATPSHAAPACAVSACARAAAVRVVAAKSEPSPGRCVTRHSHRESG